MLCTIQYHLYDLKKIEKHPWRIVTLSKVAGFWPATVLKVTLLHGCFSRFLNCTNGTKLRKHHIVILIPLRIFFFNFTLGVFHVFKIIQMVPNLAERLIYSLT